MGLTIHYTLRTSLTAAKDVSVLVRSLRDAARKLPFKDVGPVREFRDAEADFTHSGRDDPHRWLKIQAAQYRELQGQDYKVSPTHIIAFTVDPGDGCEPANFGFCLYPARVTATNKGGLQIPTSLDGLTWSSFCKTQYASDPTCGGVENFLRCHVGLCQLLDVVKATGLVGVEVRDESDYWDRRDPKCLVSTVGEWNRFVAAFAGMFKDLAESVGMAVEAAITGFPNFEHLEAQGLDELRRRHAQ